MPAPAKAGDAAIYLCVPVLVITATVASLLQPLAALVVLLLSSAALVAVRRPESVSVLLVVASLPLMRPGVLGERTAPIATGLCFAAALIALSADRGQLKVPRPYMIIVGFLALSSGWLLARMGMGGGGTLASTLQGLVTTTLTLAAIGVVLSDKQRRRGVARGFIWLVLALCASYVVTAVCWLALGIGSVHLSTFVYKAPANIAELYFPFTPTLGWVQIDQIAVPRFIGLGREPGWMAMFSAAAFFLWPRIGRPRLIGRALLLVGVIAPLSTAGFGVFVVCWAFEYMLRPRAGRSRLQAIGWFIAGVLAVATAAAIAFNAPVLGLADKSTLNSTSLTDRSDATAAGLAAFTLHPFGGDDTMTYPGINIIASIAPYGIPYALLIVAALWAPLIGHPAKGPTTAPVLVVFLTLLLSQPPGDSTLAFLIVGLAYVVTYDTPYRSIPPPFTTGSSDLTELKFRKAPG